MERNLEGILERAVLCLKEVAQFCDYYSRLCNTHTVDFITEKKWYLLSSALRKELSQLNLEQVQLLIATNVPCFLTERDTPHLLHFITDAKAHTLEALKICTVMSSISSTFPKACGQRKFPYRCMSPKKSHEVEVFAPLISSLAVDKELKVVVDAGSGKGYLSSHLTLEYGLNVLGIDNSSTNIIVATKQHKKVEYFWNKSHKKRNCTLINSKPNILQDTNCFSENNKVSDCTHSKSPSHRVDVQCGQEVEPCCGLFVPRAHHISSNCDLKCLISDFMVLLMEKNVSSMNSMSCGSCKNNEPIKDEVLLCSLHGCGNLSASLLQLFVSTQQVKVLCNVGCCYNLIEEKFFKSQFTKKGAKDMQEFGFPLSSVLMKSKYSLGRNARMLASQSIERISEEQLEPKKALFYRALLEVILREKLGMTGDFVVGSIAHKCSGFLEYVQRALRQLRLNHLQLSESDIKRYLLEYSEEEKKLYALQQLRIIMAPCIEALILLDRLVFLLEQEVVKEAHLVRLFDPVISPRCYGIIAWK